jgi:hypothetical protein
MVNNSTNIDKTNNKLSPSPSLTEHKKTTTYEEFKDTKGVIRIRKLKKNTMVKRKSTKDKQRSTKHTHKTKDRVTQTSLKIGGELRCTGNVGIFCSTRDTRRVNLITNPVISHQWGKDWELFTTNGIYPWSFVIQIFHNGQPSHGL